MSTLSGLSWRHTGLTSRLIPLPLPGGEVIGQVDQTRTRHQRRRRRYNLRAQPSGDQQHPPHPRPCRRGLHHQRSARQDRPPAPRPHHRPHRPAPGVATPPGQTVLPPARTLPQTRPASEPSDHRLLSMTRPPRQFQDPRHLEVDHGGRHRDHDTPVQITSAAAVLELMDLGKGP
jgi:hypothetical protein